MKKILIVFAALILSSSFVMAEDSTGYGLSFGYGMAVEDIDIYRIGLKKDFPAKWFEKENGYLSGYFELSYNRWEHSTGDINAIALSPVFAYYFKNADKYITPYIEFGIGGAYLDEHNIYDRRMGSNFQFEDRIGVGARIGFFDVSLRYMHYSNANLVKPNHGIDIFILSTSIQF